MALVGGGRVSSVLLAHTCAHMYCCMHLSSTTHRAPRREPFIEMCTYLRAQKPVPSHITGKGVRGFLPCPNYY
jgi:hypothetical protein